MRSEAIAESALCRRLHRSAPPAEWPPPGALPFAACRRYQRGSEICERFAQSLHHLTAIEERELFDFGSRGEAAPVLLVLDRRDDPVTPLLSQWTYQVGGSQLVGSALKLLWSEASKTAAGVSPAGGAARRGSFDLGVGVHLPRPRGALPCLALPAVQAMVHELIGISTNRVDLRHVPGVKPEFAEAVLSAQQARRCVWGWRVVG